MYNLSKTELISTQANDLLFLHFLLLPVISWFALVRHLILDFILLDNTPTTTSHTHTHTHTQNQLITLSNRYKLLLHPHCHVGNLHLPLRLWQHLLGFPPSYLFPTLQAE